MNYFYLEELIKKAFDEDFGLSGDITCDSIFGSDEWSEGFFKAKANGVICGIDVIKYIYDLFDHKIEFNARFNDGDIVKSGEKIAFVKGSTKNLLKCERIVLNFLQHLSGIATQVKEIKDALGRDDIKIVDTRKTLPGLRMLQKYAVKKGGGSNHRLGLFDTVMLKENHIKAAGSITKAVECVRKNIGHTVKIEVETTNIEEVREACDNNIDIIMLDNMCYDDMKKCIDVINKRCIVEVSGNIDVNSIKERVSDLDIDVVSVGSITHSVKAFDISFLLK